MEITRIVQMNFMEDKIDDFLKLFRATYPQIRFFEGCRFLELQRDQEKENIYYTVSKWESVTHLEHYRKSELFRSTWSITRSFFAQPPQAFSLKRMIENQTTP